MNDLQARYKKLGHQLTSTSCNLRSALRVNTLRISHENLCSRLRAQGVVLEKIPFLKDGYWYEADFSLASSTEYLLGYFYMQEPASQLCAQELSNELASGSLRILDMCAAPGSKTTHLAQLSGDDGAIIALDNNSRRLEVLGHHLERLHICSVALYKKDARFADDIGLLFDIILLDAPCSGNYCIEEDFFSKRNLQDVKKKASVQRELLAAAYRCLRPGGVLLYSTCSLEPEEDEDIVSWFIEEYKDMFVEPLKTTIGERLCGGAVKLWPQETGTQGFFIAKFTKQDSAEK